ncbi:MAG: hypothetical protein PUB18_05425 [bacterium]|nr:hypothetical protein [bacterium]
MFLIIVFIEMIVKELHHVIIAINLKTDYVVIVFLVKNICSNYKEEIDNLNNILVPLQSVYSSSYY